MPETVRPGIAGDSIREKICQYMVDQINAEGRPTKLLVGRQRSLPLDSTLLPAALVYLVSEEVERLTGRSTVSRRKAVFRVELRVEGEPSDQQLDPLIGWVVQQVLADFSAGGLVKEIEELGSKWDQSAKDIVVGAVGIDFQVTYYTQVNDLIDAP
jgi:hypothetical protein